VKFVVGYVVGFACAVVAALAGLAVLLPLGAIRVRGAKQVAMLLGSVLSGFLAAWTGDGILRLFGLRADWPFFLVLVVTFLVIEAQHASARRLPLPIAVAAQIGGLVLGWLTLLR
jgi:hypothetical protein